LNCKRNKILYLISALPFKNGKLGSFVDFLFNNHKIIKCPFSD